jgi:uncharacterized protein YjbJ (UPF0337 family)
MIMTGMTDKVKGAANKAIGAVKQGAGKAVGNPNLEAEGAVQKLKGEAQRAVGGAKETLAKVINKV